MMFKNNKYVLCVIISVVYEVYAKKSIRPSHMNISPSPEALMQPQTSMLPPPYPCFTIFYNSILANCEDIFVVSRDTGYVLIVKKEYTGTCKDCINLAKCPAASKYLRPNVEENIRKLRDAYCGFNCQGTKICCSDFSTTTEDKVENHPNLKLLPDNCGDIVGNRIIGGTVASLYEFPWMALISYRMDGNVYLFKCAGSVINSRYILTAAHCIVNENIAGVRIGDFDLRYKDDCQKSQNGGAICESHVQDIRVEDIIHHEKYVGFPKYAYDIGLLRLVKHIDFSRRNARPICLPTTAKLRNAAIANKMATIAGWGLTENNKESSVLLKVEIPIHPEDSCADLYSRILEPSESETGSTQFCAGTYHKDSCNGDSGAPLILEDKYKDVYKFIQYGIVSQGRQNCGSRTPAVYTNVSKFMLWILDKLKP